MLLFTFLVSPSIFIVIYFLVAPIFLTYFSDSAGGNPLKFHNHDVDGVFPVSPGTCLCYQCPVCTGRRGDSFLSLPDFSERPAAPVRTRRARIHDS